MRTGLRVRRDREESNEDLVSQQSPQICPQMGPQTQQRAPGVTPREGGSFPATASLGPPSTSADKTVTRPSPVCPGPMKGWNPQGQALRAGRAGTLTCGDR